MSAEAHFVKNYGLQSMLNLKHLITIPGLSESTSQGEQNRTDFSPVTPSSETTIIYYESGTKFRQIAWTIIVPWPKMEILT